VGIVYDFDFIEYTNHWFKSDFIPLFVERIKLIFIKRQRIFNY